MQFLAYLAVLLVTVSSLVLCLDVVTRPAPPAKPASTTEQKLTTARGVDVPAGQVAAGKIAAGQAENPIRKIPIVSRVNPGDPNGDLSPVYPAAPGKDLPVKDTPVKDVPIKDLPIKEAASPQPAAKTETTGKAIASTTADPAAGQAASATTAAAMTVPVTAASPMTAAAPMPQLAPQATANASPASSPPSLKNQPQSASAANSCNVEACAAAYRSFRASDCTYQPFSGPRALCENPPGAIPSGASQQAAAPASPRRDVEQSASHARASVQPERGRYEDELRDATEAVRRLPRASAAYEDDDEDGPATAGPPNMSRYGLRRNWIIENE